MKTKLFYRGLWETGYEIQDEYHGWLDSIEHRPYDGTEFHLAEKRKVGNWLIVRYWFNKNA